MSGARRAAVTGATGFVGRVLCAKLLAEGWQVRVLLRHRASGAPAGTEAFALGDLAAPGRCRWREAMDGVDHVFHLAAIAHAPRAETLHAVNVTATAALAEAAFAAGARLVHASTIKVHGDESALPIDAGSACHPADAYGRSKLLAEEAIAAHAGRAGAQWIALRPPLVYGEGEGGNFARLVRLACCGVPLPLKSIDNRRSMVHVEVLADALARAASLPQLPGAAFPVAGGEPWSTPRWLQEIAKAAGRPLRLWAAPPALLRRAAGWLGAGPQAMRLFGSLAVDDREFRALAGWTPPLMQPDAVRVTVAALRRP